MSAIERPAPPAAWGPPRQRTITWYDPRAAAAAARGLSGRDVLEAIAAGELPPPPMASVFAFEIVEIGDGEVRFAVTPDESAYNPIGAVHGGLTCTLLDTVVGCAAQTLLPAGVTYTSIDLQVSYLRPVRDGDRLLAHGWVTKPGRRVTFAQGDVRAEDGRLLATATSTLLVLSGD
jgi:uncharacterized protein (TIGR00369 family)